jgi:general stress protein YciG
MAGTKAGGLAAAITNKQRHGEDHYSKIGRIGGSKKVPKGFAMFPKDKVREAGRKGGTNSVRKPRG